MNNYEQLRNQYRPQNIKVLLIAESPPPVANQTSSRHFYRTDQVRRGDRLFVNTIKALYPEAEGQTESQIETTKQQWLRRLQSDGWFLIEALPTSLPHAVTKPQRQDLIRQNLPKLLARVRQLANPNTKLILIKSNVFEVAAEPLRQAGFSVLNTELVDYPGQYNQAAYRQKLAGLAKRV